MSTDALDLGPPVRQVKALLRGVRDDQLTASTPCEHYTVGDLLDHFVGLTLAFRYAAEKSAVPATDDVGEPIDAPGPGGASARNLPHDWRNRLPTQLDELAAAWTDPAAWQGEATAGGVTMPADVMGRVAVNELVVHSWDIARATGQPFDCDPASAQACLDFTSMMSVPGEDAGREGLFGPVVDVPPEAPVLDRALGFSGRDPAWRA